MTVSWWPPAVGDKLRHATLHASRAGGMKQVEALLRVVAVFEHDGETRIVTAEWFPSRRRWNYEVMRSMTAEVGTIWPDGSPRPGP